MSDKKQRLVITGGNGFIGSFLVEQLLNLGYKNIISLNRSVRKNNPKIKTVVCDISKNEKILSKFINKEDVVIHMACSTIPGTSEANKIKGVEENIIGSLKLLEICREKNINKFIFMSSGGAIYGDNGQKAFKESDLVNPKSLYGVIKVTVEKYIGVYEHLHKMKSVIIRASNPYGRKIIKTDKLGVVDIFLKKALDNEVIQIWGDGKNIRDYIHIDDLIDFLILAIEKDSLTGIYNIGTGVGISLNEIIRLIEKVIERKVQVIYSSQREVDVLYNVLNIEKAKAVGWKPKYNLSDGIRKLIENK